MQILRSIHQRCSLKKSILQNFEKFTGKHMCQSNSFDKVKGIRQILRKFFYIEYLLGLVLDFLSMFFLEIALNDSLSTGFKFNTLLAKHFAQITCICTSFISTFKSWYSARINWCQYSPLRDLNPLRPGIAFLYYLKTLEKLSVFCFPGV